MKKAEREEHLRKKLIEMSRYEDDLRVKGVGFIAGVDEVGRGPLAGPVCAAAVILPEGFDVIGIDDSKKLTEKRREALFEDISEKAIAIGVGMIENDRIDEINILNATKEAMLKAIGEANRILAATPDSGEHSGEHSGDGSFCVPCGTQKEPSPLCSQKEPSPLCSPLCSEPSPLCSASPPLFPQIGHLLVDAIRLPEANIPGTAIIGGDRKSVSIAAASIIAKVTRDRLMIQYDEIYPGYGFASNKGYGTKAHYEGLKKLGPTPIHRRSFIKDFH